MSTTVRLALWTVLAVAVSSDTVHMKQLQDPTAASESRDVEVDTSSVPEVRVFLTDEETGGPLRNQEVEICWHWVWDLVNLKNEVPYDTYHAVIHLEAQSNEYGLLMIPEQISIPAHPDAASTYELGPRHFDGIQIEVQDSRHNCGLAIGVDDIQDYQSGQVYGIDRNVPIWPRKNAPNRQPN